MAKDPFAELPPIEPDDHAEPADQQAPDHVEASGDVSVGSPPRTLLKSATKWSVPIMGLAIGVWLFMPQDQNATRRATPTKIEVDPNQQAEESTATLKRMKEDAAKRPVVAVPVMPGSVTVPAQPGSAAQPVSSATYAHAQAAAPAPSSSIHPQAGTSAAAPTYARAPLPPGYTNPSMPPAPTPIGQADDRAAQAFAAATARQEEIRASAIEVGKVKLLGQTNAAASAQPASLTNLQNDLVDAQAAEAARSQQAMQERMIAAMTPKEPPKSKGMNEDFLAANAAASNAAPNLARQMAPQATSIVNEGHVIRAVLQTRVNSDLPGRVLARVTSDVYDSNQRYVVIPKGSQLIGVYSSQVVVGQERLLMAMNRLILPNGSWIALSGASAADMTGVSGISADVDNHFMKMFGSSLVIGASTMLLPRQDTTVSTLQGNAGGTGGTAGSVFATSLNDVLKSLLERNRQISPTLKLREGEEFIFMVAQDMAMVPYKP